MEIRYTQIDNLPPLAWLAEIKNGIVEVIHGKRVETTENWFVEGAWSGEFAQGEFLDNDWFCGTGARLCNDKIVFSTPSHVTCGLFSKNTRGGVYNLQQLIPFNG